MYVDSHFQSKGPQVHGEFVQPARDGMEQHGLGSFDNGAYAAFCNTILPICIDTTVNDSLVSCNE